jgi:hypothetical protein
MAANDPRLAGCRTRKVRNTLFGLGFLLYGSVSLLAIIMGFVTALESIALALGLPAVAIAFCSLVFGVAAAQVIKIGIRYLTAP